MEFKPDTKIEEESEPRSSRIIGFLREYNFADKDEEAEKAVFRFKEYVKETFTGGEPPYNTSRQKEDEFKIIDLLVTELEKLGYILPGTLPHDRWSEETGKILDKVVKEFELLPKEEREKWTISHSDWRI